MGRIAEIQFNRVQKLPEDPQERAHARCRGARLAGRKGWDPAYGARP
jgi:hypothetical protein